jgi:hypothetical protein
LSFSLDLTIKRRVNSTTNKSNPAGLSAVDGFGARSACAPDTVQRSVLTTSTEATVKSRSTFVDATLALNEVAKRHR